MVARAEAATATHERLLASAWRHFSERSYEEVLRHGIDRAADTGHSVVLETFAERSVPFYLRNGFEVLVDDVEPVSSLRFWALRHVPRR